MIICESKSCITKSCESLMRHTPYECEICGEPNVHRSINPPKICPKCAVKEMKCQFCKKKV